MKSLFVHGLNHGLNHGIPRGKSPDLPQIPPNKGVVGVGPPADHRRSGLGTDGRLGEGAEDVCIAN